MKIKNFLDKNPGYEIIGWVGAFFFAISALPQVVQVWQTRQTEDLSLLMIVFWYLGGESA